MNHDLLVTWKEIASYLKCSVRKAQRLEGHDLPVRRIPGTKAVWASKAEVDRWLSDKSEKAVSDPPSSTPTPSFWFPGQFPLLFVLFILTAVAAASSAYGLTIFLFVLEASLMAITYPRLQDRPGTRAFFGIFVIMGISYAAAATSLPEVLSTAVNMSSLPPAFGYPFVAGLRFIPIPALVVATLVVADLKRMGGFHRSPRLNVAYLAAGILLLGMMGLIALFEMRGIWQARLPIRWTLLAGELFICAVNLLLLHRGYRFFRPQIAAGYARFLSQCGMACLVIVLTASINNRHWNQLNESHLDALNPVPYAVRSSEPATAFQQWVRNHSAEAGRDLVELSNDPYFLGALQNEKFYKQDFDEAFQFPRRAVIFGFREAPQSRLRTPGFFRVRFPADLAAVLRFDPDNP